MTKELRRKQKKAKKAARTAKRHEHIHGPRMQLEVPANRRVIRAVVLRQPRKEIQMHQRRRDQLRGELSIAKAQDHRGIGSRERGEDGVHGWRGAMGKSAQCSVAFGGVLSRIIISLFNT